MANSYIHPVSGQEDPNVIPKNGKVAFDIPIYQMKTAAGTSFDLTLSYKSSLLKEDYSTWAAEAPSNTVAVGWSININDRIFLIDKSGPTYGLYLNGMFYKLNYISTDEAIKHFKTVAHSLLNIYYDSNTNIWMVYLEDGTEYIFGNTDPYNNEKGTYYYDTGTYSQASKEYSEVRKLISDPDEQDIPSRVNSDNTICTNIERTLCGYNYWVAPTSNTKDLKRKSTQWLLSHIRDAFDNIIAFSYIHHTSNLIGTNTVMFYSVSSYLYRISLYHGGIETEKIVLTYDKKDRTEYNVDFTATPRPNGMQQKFEKLYLKKLSRYSCKFSDFQENATLWLNEETLLVSKLIHPATNITKRQLSEVKFLTKDSGIETIPSYQMTYYGSSDGVSVGAIGFNDTEHLYFNGKTGAVFGALKTLIYPSGVKKTYRYTEHDINSVFTTYSEKMDPNHPPIVIHTPFSYTLIIQKYGTKMIYHVLTMSAGGWYKTTLATLDYSSDFDFERYLSYSENLIGIVDLITPQNHSLYVFVRNKEKDGEWITGNGFPKQLTGNLEKMTLDVSDTGIAYYDNVPGEPQGVVHFIPTENQGLTFGDIRTYLLKMIATANKFWVFVKILNNKCFVFVMETDILTLPKPTWWSGSSEPVYDTYYVSTGGIDSAGQFLPASVLGEPVFFNCSYQFESHIYKIEGNVMSGTKVEQPIGIDVVGNLFMLRYKTRGRSIWFRRIQSAIYEYSLNLQQAKNSTEWVLPLFYNVGEQSFCYIDQTVLDKAFKLEKTGDLEQWINKPPTVECGVKTSDNGMIYTVHINSTSEIELDEYFALFITYLGGSISNFKVQVDESNEILSCIMKDNMFAAFQAKLAEHAYGKKYMYYHVLDSTWYPINTGAIASPSITYNDTAETTLKVLSGIGITLFIILFPFGLSSVAGVICTALSTGLFIAAEVAVSFLQSSFKSSLNLDASYFGNRYINDGTTVWFRERRQDRLTAIGSGTSFQPHDSLNPSSDSGQGKVVTDKQQFGHVYNYIPFFTDQNRLCYRPLKNDGVDYSSPIGGLSIGCNDLYVDPSTGISYAFKDCYVYEFSPDGLTSITKHQGYPGRTVDACCLLKKGNDSYRIFFTGDEMVYSRNLGPYIKLTINKALPQYNLTYLDCALEVFQDSINASRFYLFSGTHYQLFSATLDETPTFEFVEQGTLKDFLSKTLADPSTFPFDKLDAAYSDRGFCLIRGNRFIKYGEGGTVNEQGRLGNEWFHQNIDPNDTELYFTGEAMAYYNKVTGDFQLNSYVGGSINDGIRNHAVDTVSNYTDPRLENKPTSICKYLYHTDNSSYSIATGTPVYRTVEVCAADEEEY